VNDVTGLTFGMSVTGSSIAAGVTVTAVNAANRTVALSNGALVSADDASVSFGSTTLPSAKNGTLTATVTNNSSTVTIPGTTAGITIGQTVSGTGIPANAVVIAIINNTQITIGQIVGENAVAINATANASSVTFASNSTAAVTRTADTDSGARIIVSSTLGMQVGQVVSGNGIPGGSTILRILDANTVEISNPVAGTGQNNLTYGAGGTIGATLLSTTTGGSATITVPLISMPSALANAV
jgi:hypothetical protein